MQNYCNYLILYNIIIVTSYTSFAPSCNSTDMQVKHTRVHRHTRTGEHGVSTNSRLPAGGAPGEYPSKRPPSLHTQLRKTKQGYTPLAKNKT